MKNVAVIIPIYKPRLSQQEAASLTNTLTVLKEHDIFLIYPETMDVTVYKNEYAVQYVAVTEEWLGVKNGIAGYNQMMLSESFYAMFSNYEYILICHTDAWVFRDELLHWCEKGYDCVAAPWVKRKVYDNFIVSRFYRILDMVKGNNKITRRNLYGKIGNGGLSLRKVSSFRAACVKYSKEIDAFNANRHHLFNEDVFWAMVPVEFMYPKQEEAIQFSFDRHPDYCYKMNHHKLPFGCHSWNKPKMFKFWKNIIKA